MFRPPISTLFPYTTLFRSHPELRLARGHAQLRLPFHGAPLSGPLRHLSPGVRSLRDRCLARSEEHTSELQSRLHLVCRLLLEKKTVPPVFLGERFDDPLRD